MMIREFHSFCALLNAQQIEGCNDSILTCVGRELQISQTPSSTGTFNLVEQVSADSLLQLYVFLPLNIVAILCCFSGCIIYILQKRRNETIEIREVQLDIEAKEDIINTKSIILKNIYDEDINEIVNKVVEKMEL